MARLPCASCKPPCGRRALRHRRTWCRRPLDRKPDGSRGDRVVASGAPRRAFRVGVGQRRWRRAGIPGGCAARGLSGGPGRRGAPRARARPASVVRVAESAGRVQPVPLVAARHQRKPVRAACSSGPCLCATLRWRAGRGTACDGDRPSRGAGLARAAHLSALAGRESRAVRRRAATTNMGVAGSARGLERHVALAPEVVSRSTCQSRGRGRRRSRSRATILQSIRGWPAERA